MKTQLRWAAAVVVLGLDVAGAHMHLSWPTPLRSRFKAYTSPDDVDYSMTSPPKPDGSDWPCNGYQALYDDPEGAPVVDWQAGRQYNVTMTGLTSHRGGSCQASLSYDRGKTFRVLHSWVGGCPAMSDSTWRFTIPDDTPSGDALFAWTWFNRVGNRAMYINCARVAISAAGKRPRHLGRRDKHSFEKRPPLFVANVGNGCSTVEGKDVLFPEPGPDVEFDVHGDSTAAPEGNCTVVVDVASGPSASDIRVIPISPGAVNGSSASPLTSFTTSTAPAGGTRPASRLCTGTGQSGRASAVATNTATAPAFPTNSSSNGAGGDPSPSSGGSGGFAQGIACSKEGEWNCVEGTHFQRCASGRWTALMSMASGTRCRSGQSSSLVYSSKRLGSRRYADPWRV